MALTCCLTAWHGPPLSAKTGLMIPRQANANRRCARDLEFSHPTWLPVPAICSLGALFCAPEGVLRYPDRGRFISTPAALRIVRSYRPHDGDLSGGRFGQRRRGRADGGRLRQHVRRLRQRGGRRIGFCTATGAGGRVAPEEVAIGDFCFGAVAVSAGCRKISDSLPTLAASKILNACSGLTSTVTAFATVGRPGARRPFDRSPVPSRAAISLRRNPADHCCCWFASGRRRQSRQER